MDASTLYALGLVGEEMGEAAKEIGKALRFGLDTPAPDCPPYNGTTPRQRLTEELGDVAAAIEYATQRGLVDRAAIARAKIAKLDKLLSPESKDHLGRRLAP